MFWPILRSVSGLDHTNSPCTEPRETAKLRLTLNVSLKTEEDIEEAVKFFNDTI
jgi:hypothetical protein